SADGDWTPASEASQEELVGLAQAFDGLEHGVLQMVNDFDLERDPNRFDAEFDILEAFARAGAGHNMSLSLMQRDMAPNQWCKILERVDTAQKDDLTIHVQVAPRGIGVMVGLSCTFHPFMGFPSYKSIADKSLEERVAIMRAPDFKVKMLTEKSESVSGEGSSVPPLVDIFLQNLEMVSAKLFRLGEQPDYEQPFEQSIYMQAKAADMPVLEAIYEAVLENDGRALLYFPIYNYTEFDYANVLTMLRHPHAIPGLSDGGAHVGTVCDASFPTYTLSHWTRDRTRGEKIKLKDAVHFMTQVPAQYLGLDDRGVLKEGAKADINVIDHEKLNLKHPHMIKDLPGGGQRLMQHAQGYRATIVSGQIVLENDVLSEARPGRLVRLHELGA
ncbi:MAG: amidohydrolase family protein, partial [Myxococcota bacterium]|nr:amidohydrolase family protein [Myxococcota bacterium]